jgi:hypothetical protein
VLESLARALRLDGNERRHLFLLAYGHLPPEMAEPQRAVSLLLQQFIERQGDNPTFVNNSRWDIVAWNRAACAVFGDYEKMSDRERNSMWRLFCTPSGRELMGDHWEKSAKRRLAQFRANYGKYVEDPWWTDMIAALHRESAEFREWWPQHEVLHSPEGRKTVYHPVEGPLYFDHLTFDVVDSVDLQMTVNIPADPETAAKLRRLLEAD